MGASGWTVRSPKALQELPEKLRQEGPKERKQQIGNEGDRPRHHHELNQPGGPSDPKLHRVGKTAAHGDRGPPL